MKKKEKKGWHNLSAECKFKAQNLPVGQLDFQLLFHEIQDEVVIIDFDSLISSIKDVTTVVEINKSDYNNYYDDPNNPLGEGAFAKVYKAMHLASGTLVAIKEFKAAVQKTAEETEMVANEIKICHRIRHPNCISYIGSTIEDTTMIIVLEFADGGDLFTVLERKSQSHFDELTAARCISHVLQAIEYLHSNSIVHLDVKLENILYSIKTDTYKLTDFGISRIIDEETRESNPDGYIHGVQGTCSYMAPEIIRQPSQYTDSVDIFALGVVLYMLLTGISPWKNEDDIEASIILYDVDWDSLNNMPVSAEAVDITKLLMKPSSKRILPKDAKNHSWFKKQNAN